VEPVSTIHEQIASARQRLRAAGIPSDEATLDARLLAQHVLGWDAAALLCSGQTPAPDQFGDRYQSVLDRRVTREPLAYITGTKDFWHLTIGVSRAVLIPRPETELLVEAALGRLPAGGRADIADVCTGSGCIAVALATERRESRIVATDISEHALRVAQGNIRRHGVGDRIDLLRADLLSGVTAQFDLIVSNPPYVPLGDRAGLQPEVRNFEPSLALFAGGDGLDLFEGLIGHAALRLKPGGFLMFEFGTGQEPAVSALISESPRLTMVAIKSDLQGIPRVAIAKALSPEP
jgi:release factor glutamine methyltransferase